jgi:hypothetical protein
MPRLALPGAYTPASIALRVTGVPKSPLHDKAILLEEFATSFNTQKLYILLTQRTLTGWSLLQTECVSCEVRTGFLDVILMKFVVQNRKYKRLKLCGSHAYDHSSDWAAVVD